MTIPPTHALLQEIRQTIKNHLDDLKTLEGVWDSSLSLYGYIRFF